MPHLGPRYGRSARTEVRAGHDGLCGHAGEGTPLQREARRGSPPSKGARKDSPTRSRGWARFRFLQGRDASGGSPKRQTLRERHQARLWLRPKRPPVPRWNVLGPRRGAEEVPTRRCRVQCWRGSRGPRTTASRQELAQRGSRLQEESRQRQATLAPALWCGILLREAAEAQQGQAARRQRADGFRLLPREHDRQISSWRELAMRPRHGDASKGATGRPALDDGATLLPAQELGRGGFTGQGLLQESTRAGSWGSARKSCGWRTSSARNMV